MSLGCFEIGGCSYGYVTFRVDTRSSRGKNQESDPFRNGGAKRKSRLHLCGRLFSLKYEPKVTAKISMEVKLFC